MPDIELLCACHIDVESNTIAMKAKLDIMSITTCWSKKASVGLCSGVT